MHQEIERKFLVTGDDWRGKAEGVLYKQGYLARTVERTVRARVAGNIGSVTIKIKKNGIKRDEFEYEIPLDDAMKLIDSMAPGEVIEKKRYTFKELGHVWEVDEFLGANKGLIVAEVELESEDEHIEKPAWVGEEVSRLSKYLNVQLCSYPYTSWPENRG